MKYIMGLYLRRYGNRNTKVSTPSLTTSDADERPPLWDHFPLSTSGILLFLSPFFTVFTFMSLNNLFRFS